jgi:predicted dehydrogenase
VFVEKPFCSTLSEAKELLLLAAKYNVHLYVDDVFLHRSELVHRKEPVTKSIKFIWHKDGPFNDSLTNDLLYHDLYILISIIGFRSVSNLKSHFNEKNILAFEFYYGDCKVQIDYDRTRKGEKQKTIYLDDKVIQFFNGSEDPLKLIILDCLNQQADFKLNHELNLETMHLIEIITTKLEDQL